MIRHLVYIFLFTSVSLFEPVHAQFINLQLRIEPELSTTVEQDLDFGTQITNSGRTEIQLGDINMGIFSIRAFHTQNVYLNLEYPDVLANNDPEINAEIPLELSLAYNNTGTNMVTNSTTLPTNNGMVSIHQSTQREFDNEVWKEMYIYVYGAIEIGNIPNGIYTGDIVLSIDYD